jgi:hypothetical protein
VHKDITKAAAIKYEFAIGGVTHYVLGGALALTYPALYLILDAPLPHNHLLPGILWGVATALLPWIIFYPVFGWGFFGVKAPQGMRPVLSPTVSHLVYGLALGIILNALSPQWTA